MANDAVTVVVAAPTETLVPQAQKPGKFAVMNFKGWQQRVFFWLTTLGLQKFTSEDTLVPADDMPDREKIIIIEAWKQTDFLCKGYILSALEDDLYNNDFKNYLKHKRKEMKLEDLVTRLKIEKDNNNAEINSRKISTIIGVNIVEEAPTKDKKRKKSNGQKSEQAKKKFEGNCYNCGMAGHRSSDCHAPRKDKNKGKGKSQANIVEKMEDADDLCAMILECNLVGNLKECFIDLGATRHICSAKQAFTTYTPGEYNEDLFMENTATTRIAGTGKVMLKMTSGKLLTLNNV
ncbi:uncharacterized protein [Solanum lycopersicum]|uniref:uncharacterized protein n=1 Tax=Solanum lycopersicum TaxID=4081 RepID=UPI003749EE1E